MKIRMKDFLCYADSTFDFGNSGVTLLSGPSGVGKTSILRGIFFALFGEGNKLQSCGSVSCRVEFEFEGLKIVRTKRPNRLVVNDVHEDESGQGIIDKMFGDTFKVSGYIQQNNLNSFILMSPIEKLIFLEKFAFRDVDLGKIKGRCKAYISQTSDNLTGVVAQLGMAKNVLEEMKQPEEKKFPLKCKKSEREKSIKNEFVKIKNCTILISRTERNLKKLSEEISAVKVLDAETGSRKETLSNLENTLQEINDSFTKIKYDGDEVLASLEESLTSVISLRDLYSIQKQLKSDIIQLEEMRKQEVDEMSKQLVEYENELWKEYSKSEIISSVDDLKNLLSDLVKIESLKQEIIKHAPSAKNLLKARDELSRTETEFEEKQKKYDKLNSRKGLYFCPSCSSSLRLFDEKLVISSGEKDDVVIEADMEVLKEEIYKLKLKINNFQKTIQDEENKLVKKTEAEAEIESISSLYEEIPSIESVKDDLQYLRDYQISQLDMEKKKKDLEQNIKEEKFSSSYFTFKKGVEKLKSRQDYLEKKFGKTQVGLNEEYLREQISEQKQRREKLLDLEKRQLETINSIDNCKKFLDNAFKRHIKEYTIVNKINDIEIKFLEETKILENLQIKKKNNEKIIQEIEEWEKYQTEIENYNGWKIKINELERLEKIARNEYASATKMKDKILEAESIAMLNIIDSINTHARVYLDSFFPDNPISVNLQTFKETKKSTKPQINIEIEYKGMESDINMLSGGELSRVILAYTMALAEMFNTPLLLLDECTSSLDQELTETVFTAIRENFNGKLTLLIAHQVVTGVFDKIIKLGSEK